MAHAGDLVPRAPGWWPLQYTLIPRKSIFWTCTNKHIPYWLTSRSTLQAIIDRVTRDIDSIRLESRFLWFESSHVEQRCCLDSRRVTFFNKWLDLNHNYYRIDTRARVIITKSSNISMKTQFVCTERNERFCFSEDYYCRKFPVLTVSPFGVMIHFKDQVFHLTRKYSWDFAFYWGASKAQ